MKVNSFITVYNARMKHIQEATPQIIMETIIELIHPIQYISYDNKLKLIKKTIEESQNNEFPTAVRHRNLIVNLISAYTNLEMTNKDFDLLSQNKMLDVILLCFESEYKICNSLMEMCLYDIESGCSNVK